MKEPSNAIIAVTSNCNSRCVMCDIWKKDKESEVYPYLYKHLPSSLKDINITGGEPFLRKDLSDIIAVVKDRCKKARIVISTNGFLTQRIKEETKKILAIDRNIAIRISIDGADKTHDEIRGVSGGFRKSIDTIRCLQEIGVRDLGIGFTISSKNVAMIKNTYDLANHLGVEFSITVVTSSPIYFGDNECLKPENNGILKIQFSDLIRSELSYWNLKKWLRAYYDYTLFEYIKTQKRTFPCDAGESFFYLDPKGNIHPCNVLDLDFGNINNNSFKNIWASDNAKNIRNNVKKCSNCWMICTVKTSFKKSVPYIALWLIRNRLKMALGVKELLK